MKKNRQLKFETIQLHAGQETPDPATGARAVPIYQTTSYVFRDCTHAQNLFELSEPGNIYGRLTNTTQEVFEKRIAALEGGSAALAVASGAAAVTYTIQNLAKAGDHIVASKYIYGGSYNLLEHTLKDQGIRTTFADPDDLESFESAVRENTKAIFLESIGNPNANLADIRKIADIAHRYGIVLVVDSTFATPFLFRPFEYGADIVIHSATKFIGGHGTALGGVVIESGKFDWEKSGKYPQFTRPDPSYHGVRFCEAAGDAAFVTRMRAVLLRDMGAAIAPLHAFLFLQGLETLSLRVERHIENTKKVVEFLENHPKIERVNHPSLPQSPYYRLYQKYFPKGGASIFTFEIRGSEQDTKEFIDRLEIFSLLANVADVKSLVIHPASTTHSQMTETELHSCGIRPNTVRVSIGTEHIEDILYDLEQALEGVPVINGLHIESEKKNHGE